MKAFVKLISLLCLIYFTHSLKDNGNNLYTVDYVFSYFNEYLKYNEQNYQEILDSISKILANSYAFNDIAKNPPQPSKNYHSIVDIQEQLKEIELKDIKDAYDFFRKIFIILADLKDPHLRMFFNQCYFNYFFIIGPFDYYIKEYEGKQRIFAECLSNDIVSYFEKVGEISVLEFCKNYNYYPIKSINGKDPFEYINNFGGNFVASKNIHGTFSYKLNFNNWVSLNDYPLSQEELNNLEVIFDDEDETTIKTKFLIQSQFDLNYDESNLRLLSNNEKLFFNNKNEINKNNLKENIKNKNLRKLLAINWNYETEDIFKCYADETNNINFYFVASFEPNDRQKYIETMLKCVELFDKNTYPIVVINEMNAGGYASLAQLFMGVLSPLMPINLFKGRLRITESLQKSDEILHYINSNLTNVHNCQKASLDELLNKKVQSNYSKIELTDMFYINNITLHNRIEEVRKTMKNKRKPTEILLLTDGYSFSTTALYIKYLQKMGGAMVVGFKGNPYDNSIFDSGQSPSMIFTPVLINIFNKEETEILKKYNIELEIPGIQTFYDLNDKDVPLEYEVTPVDKRINLYEEFKDDTYYLFVEEFLNIFNEINSKCYSNNLIKFSEKCDSNFKKHTHGGYACNNDGTWSNKCVEAYCDLGYSFDKNQKKCIKDVCSSIPIDDDDDDNDNEDGGNNSSFSSFLSTKIMNVIGLLLFLI